MRLQLKKSLGQHFLIDESICKKIISSLQTISYNQLVEVGAGGGALTKYLVPLKNIHLKIIEIDKEKIIGLEKQFPTLKENIMATDFLSILPPFEKEFVIIGNFPYNISSQIVFKMLEWKNQVPYMIGMFQKEVADRIVSTKDNKNYGILSVLVQTFYSVEYVIENVLPSAFNPPPKVHSAVILFKRLENPPPIRSEKHFFNLVKQAFNQRRKILRNPLKLYFTQEQLTDTIFSKRAENLSIHDFAKLSFLMKSN